MKELLACSHVSVRGPGTGLGVWMGGPAPWGVTRLSLLPQPFSKSAIEHVQGHLVKKQVPPDLFQVCAGLVPTPAQPSEGPPWAA